MLWIRFLSLYYFSSAGLRWEAMLKMTGYKLDLITDEDIYQLFSKGIRGLVSYMQRYSEANNKRMESHDKDKPSKYIV